MGQMGHTLANLTLAVYAREMDRRDGEPERLKALVEGREWAANGQQEASTMVEAVDGLAGLSEKVSSAIRVGRAVIAALGGSSSQGISLMRSSTTTRRRVAGAVESSPTRSASPGAGSVATR